MGVFECRIMEETPTAGHRWGCGGTGPDDQERVLMWSELAHGTFMWSQSEPFLQSGCMEVIWVHLGVQTGYIVNTQ